MPRPPTTHRLLIAVPLTIALCAPARAAAPTPTLSTFDSAPAALQSLLPQKTPQKIPKVIALGELHEIEGGPKVTSSLSHFKDELLPVLAPLSTDLILETWVTQGNCGKQEAEVVNQVQETTQRPEATESELVQLIHSAKKAGVAPHILELSCKQYQAILQKDGEIDYVALLSTITRLLEQRIDEALKPRPQTNPPPTGARAVLVYGGAVHNELAPRPELRPFTYAPSVQKKTRGQLLSIDLFVPELVDRNDDAKAQSWYPLLARIPAGRTGLIRRGPASYILIFARSQSPLAHPKPDPIPAAAPK